MQMEADLIDWKLNDDWSEFMVEYIVEGLKELQIKSHNSAPYWGPHRYQTHIPVRHHRYEIATYESRVNYQVEGSYLYLKPLLILLVVVPYVRVAACVGSPFIKHFLITYFEP